MKGDLAVTLTHLTMARWSRAETGALPLPSWETTIHHIKEESA